MINRVDLGGEQPRDFIVFKFGIVTPLTRVSQKKQNCKKSSSASIFGSIASTKLLKADLSLF